MTPLAMLHWHGFSRSYELAKGTTVPPDRVTIDFDGQPWEFEREGPPRLDVYGYRALTPPPPERPTFYGIRVRLDPSVPAGEIRLEPTP